MSGPEFGPRGYVPPKAAKRARKIVLREPMGLGWPIAAAVAGVLLAAVGALYLLTQTGPPGPPFESLGPLDQVDARGAAVLPAERGEVLVVRAGGGVRAFTAPGGEVGWCTESKRLESDAGAVWALDGSLLGGPGDSLAPLRSQVHNGTLYVDTSTPLAAPPARGHDTAPRCGIGA